MQTFGKVIKTAFDRALVRTTSALLTVLLATVLLTSLLTLSLLILALLVLALLSLALLLSVERLFAFTNPLGNTIAGEPVRRILQLPRGSLLSLSLALAHRTRRLLDVLLKSTHRISQRILSFRQLLACLARVLILPVLSAAARETLHVFRNLTLPRRRLRGALTQIRDLLLAPGRT